MERLEVRNDVPNYDPEDQSHYWMVLAGFRVDGFPRERIVLSRQSMVVLAPPGCYYCEVDWEPGLEDIPCPGPTSGEMWLELNNS